MGEYQWRSPATADANGSQIKDKDRAPKQAQISLNGEYNGRGRLQGARDIRFGFLEVLRFLDIIFRPWIVALSSMESEGRLCTLALVVRIPRDVTNLHASFRLLTGSNLSLVDPPESNRRNSSGFILQKGRASRQGSGKLTRHALLLDFISYYGGTCPSHTRNNRPIAHTRHYTPCEVIDSGVRIS